LYLRLAFFTSLIGIIILPNYTFKNTNTNETFDVSMRIAELDQYKLDNPHLSQLIVRAPAIGDAHRLGRLKPDDGFRDVLRNVKHHHKKDNINTW
jgi:hypothetical protein